jgi:hypothetical protein
MCPHKITKQKVSERQVLEYNLYFHLYNQYLGFI